jgi:drug/metabolite transporter (DMT)-like permease
MKNEKNLVAYLALGAVCIIWGTTYLGLRIGVTQFPPFLFSLIRFLCSGLILSGFMLTLGKAAWPDKKTLINQAICGFFMVTMGISVVGYAEVHVSSSVAAVICSVMPVWTILINLVVSKDEKPNWLILSGAAIGLSGIVMIFGEHLSEFSDPSYTQGIVLIFAANFCWAVGSIFIKKKNQHSDPFLNAGLQMLFGGIMLIPFSLVLDDYTNLHASPGVIYSLVYMVLVGSVAAYACYSYAIKKLPMTIVSLYAYINPIVAVILGWLILSEKLNLRIGIAILVTVAGIYLVNRAYQLKTQPLRPLDGIRTLIRNLRAISIF